MNKLSEDDKQHFAVCGNPVDHSLSPHIHHLFARQFALPIRYVRQKLPVEGKKFEHWVVDFFAQGGSGLNITLPFKERAYALADVLGDGVRQSKAANTLYMHAGDLCAQNTDGLGLVRDMQNLGIDCTGKRVLIVGAGGAVAGVLPVILAMMPPEVCIVANRTLTRAQSVLDRCAHQRHALSKAKIVCDFIACEFTSLHKCMKVDIVINALAIGTDVAIALPIHAKTQCYDLSYSVTKDTPFCQLARQQGALFVVDGLGMLVEQGALSFAYWLGKMPDTSPVLATLRSS